MRALTLFVCLPLLASAQVRVEIFENLAKGEELRPAESLRTEQYMEPAFGFVRTPIKYSPAALPLDRSTPFTLKAKYERSLPAAKLRLRLRARGAAVLTMDGKEIARTKPQKPNTSGDDPVPPPPVIDETGHRPAPYPHQDVFAEISGDGASHRFELVALIGGKGLMPTPGELAVSWGREGEMERLLGPDHAPRLVDAEWEAFVARQEQTHIAADRARRLAASEATAAQWRARHDKVRAFYQARLVPVPQAPTGYPVSNDIDRFLAIPLAAAKTAPKGSLSDLEFLRRLSLDLTGLIPTQDEVTQFLAAPAATRRKQAVDKLLNSPAWADHWTAYWQDVLAENPGILKPDLNNTGPFRYWIHQSFLDGVPFDRFVTELIQMEGSNHLGGPAGFAQSTLNDAPMAAKADILAQAFLGTKLSCARCHDAPFHPYKQKDLFSMSAMLAGKPVTLPAASSVPIVEGARKPAVEITLKPGDTIHPDWPFATLIDHADSGALPAEGKLDSRRQLAAFFVAPENDRFARVVVNRVWKRYMGLGLVEPVDDWANAKPSHPELLSWLAREFVLSGYDMKHLARLIVNSHAYQRKPVEALTEQNASPSKRLFAGPLRRRLSAEQLVDSLHLAVGKNFQCEDLNLNPAGDRAPNQFLDMGRPTRAWQLTALSNERDRPALALPIAQSLIDVMSAYGWRQSRQNPASSRDDGASPMQTLILANGVLGTRIVRLSDDSAFTALALADVPLRRLISDTFFRVLSRPPSPEELRTMTALLEPVYASRKVAGADSKYVERRSDNRVSWSNHLSAEATVIRMKEERELRMGDQPTAKLTSAFRERFEDALWALVNSPEFVLMP
jgi:hypothetical protein